MKKIAFVNITPNAMGPMANCLKDYPEIQPMQYLDASITGKIAAAGGVTDACMGRMLQMVAHACEDGADGIVLTCTVFSPYVPCFRELFSVPVVGADVAMMEMAGKEPGKKALLCTFENTRETSANLLKKCCEAAGTETDIDTFVLKDAFDAAAAGDFRTHDALIREKIREAGNCYDQIVLAQMSMADAARGMQGEGARIFTSPQAACETILSLL